MNIVNKDIDNGKAFDWGRTSQDYAEYRDIYPPIFFKNIVDRGFCIKGQNVLDVGTGTGVVPRSMYQYGASWTGIDIAENQIEQAKRLSKGMDISYFTTATENISFPEKSFDVITACQCFWYFDHEKVSPIFAKLLKENGRLLVLFMAWLPLEDKIAKASEDLILKYSPKWTGANQTRHPNYIAEPVLKYFDIVNHNEYDIKVPFTKAKWHGRVKTCRGIGASLTPKEIESWEKEHLALLDKIAPEEFDILHYAAITELKVK